MYNLKDIIVALATNPGKSALHVIRVSGSKKILDLFSFLTFKKTAPKPNLSLLYKIYNSSRSHVVDQAIITFFKAPKSFTGENVLELSVHGSTVVVNQVLDLIVGFGARLALPGEFSYRAFIHNKIDLIQAEAINNIINTNNNVDLFYGVTNLEGGLSKTLNAIFLEIQKILALAEHELDFDEEEITFTKSSAYIKIMQKMIKQLEQTLKISYYEKQKPGPRVAIVGAPNVGKSSLFNCIVGYDRAIVTNIKGTTRDTIEATISINKSDLVLVDTAGIRSGANQIEKKGINRTIKEIKKSDWVVYIQEKKYIKRPAYIQNTKASIINVFNKADIYEYKNFPDAVSLSCKTGEGVDVFLLLLSKKIKKQSKKTYKKFSFYINKRQRALIETAKDRILFSLVCFKDNQDLVLLSSNLRLALDSFNSLFRPVDNNEILNSIFKGFCVGK